MASRSRARSDEEKKQEAAVKLGMAVREIVDIAETPAGVAFHLFDGTVLIDVDPATPDAAGKSGLMFLVPPIDDYKGEFPVFAQAPAEPDVEEDVES